MVKIVNARYTSGYTIEVTFSDGKNGYVDLEKDLWGDIFEPLRNPEMFRKFTVSPIFDTICWENGADISPEYLYSKVR